MKSIPATGTVRPRAAATRDGPICLKADPLSDSRRVLAMLAFRIFRGQDHAPRRATNRHLVGAT